MEMREDSALIKAAQDGDSESFGRLYDRYAAKLYRFIYYKVHHRETAQDLLSDTFMKALRSLPSFSPDRGTATSWLYSIARNSVIDHYRRTRPTDSIEDAWSLAEQSRAEIDADTAMRLGLVREHLAQLSPTEREIVIMRVWDEMSHQEIAAALGKSEDACKVTFSRAVKKLRKSMPLGLFILLVTNRL